MSMGNFAGGALTISIVFLGCGVWDAAIIGFSLTLLGLSVLRWRGY